MTNREKVIKALGFCLMPPSREELENDICSHEDCPYYREYNGGKCVSAVAKDALALLKAQEPRVMTLEEAQGAEYCWFEHKSMKPVIVANVYMCYGKVTGKTASEIRRLGYSKVDLLLDEDYGISWRCWTARPTDEQREAVKWE